MSNMTDPIFSDERKEGYLKYLEKLPWIGEWIAPKDKVAVIRMAGVIADSSTMRRAGINFKKYEEVIDKAFAVSKLKAVALVINSPGGAPAQCSLIANKIRKLSQEKEVPIYAFVEDAAASGGYWLACIGEEIYAQETSIVGSIGVISAGFGLEDFIQKHDIHRRIYTAGKDKSFLDPFKSEKADDVMRLKALLDSMHQSFKDWVNERRGVRLKGDESELMEGGFWDGKGALERGLIDGLGDMNSVMKEKFGEHVKFVDLSPEKKNILSTIMPFGSGDAVFDPSSLLEVAEEKSAWGRIGL
jgi:signal peptide peptidase SppA